MARAFCGLLLIALLGSACAPWHRPPGPPGWFTAEEKITLVVPLPNELTELVWLLRLRLLAPRALVRDDIPQETPAWGGERPSKRAVRCCGEIPRSFRVLVDLVRHQAHRSVVDGRMTLDLQHSQLKRTWRR